jgi:LPXTG-motif cell wall-anchored protein
MNYFKRISWIVIIATTLALILAYGILFTQQMIKANISQKTYSHFEFDPHAIEGTLNDNPDKSGLGKFRINEHIPLNKHKKTKHSNHSNQNAMLALFIIVFILLGTILFIFFKKKKKKNQSIFPIEESRKLSKTSKTNKKETNLNKQSLLPTEQIRIMLIEWEKQLPKSQQRKSYETIQQWFERIGKNHEIVPFYEKVRYGKKQILNEEIELVRKFLNYS